MAPEDDDLPKTGPFCVVWLYKDTPEAFERAARFARQNCGYGMQVVIVFTEAGARLLQTDRMAHLFRVPGMAALVDDLVEHKVTFEFDIGAARRVGLVETLGVAIPTLRVADEDRLAELSTGARMTARY